ncbi:class D sortase [Alkalicoccus chagannorensis]|uniref:class D sortase n=1 Tax=Alkalicoccus chagannorensis TaxID=427072 RepID=UPI000421C4EA|nr:class D sortase [Alkalicoccus chagannorensis]
MRKAAATFLLTAGLAFAGWNGYTWATESSSGRESLSESDVFVQEEELAREEVSDVEDDTNESGNNAENGYNHANMNNENNTNAADSSQEENRADNENNADPQGAENEEPEPRSYDEYENGDDIGWLMIPELDMKYPIYWGTDDETLDQGVGYHEGDFTTPPDGLRHTVLSGHRDTVFRELGDLEDGDKMYIQFEGVQYEYEIDKTWITDAEDRSVIVDKDEPTLTLTTCYPFTFIGPAPDRYIIEAPLTDTTEL